MILEYTLSANKSRKRIVFGILLIGILFMTGMASAQDTLVIRGNIVNEPESPELMPAWDARTFPGFFLDLDHNRKTEFLKINQMLSEINASRSIGEKMLTYQTGKAMVEFNVHKNEGLNVIDLSDSYKDAYAVVGWKGEKWAAVKGNANKLTRLVYEMDTEDKKTLSAGESWTLGAGYELVVNAVDAGISPRQVWFSLKKDGEIIDDGISIDKKVYFKTRTIAGESDALLFAVYVENIFSGTTKDLVQFKYAWLIDADSAIELAAGDKYDAFTIKEATRDYVFLENDKPVNLSRNTEIKFFGDISFKIADSDGLRFYPFVEYGDPGTYKIRGNVFSSPEDDAVKPFWNAGSFSGFFYDFENSHNTETLAILNQNLLYLNMSRTIDDGNLLYQTEKTTSEFIIHKMENLDVINNSEYYADTYPVAGWKGEKHVAVKGNANKLAKLVLEMDGNEEKTLAAGETWVIGAGYELNVIGIDMDVPPKQVWFGLKKDGYIIDEGIASEKSVYAKTTTLLGESGALLFSVYVENISVIGGKDTVKFKYAWLIDADSAKEIISGEKYDAFTVKEATKDRIVLENKGSVSLSMNSIVKLLGDISFKVADSEYLRFYPEKVMTIGEGSIPDSLLISIDQGEKYTISRSVTLSLSAINATQMSFSNDGSSWSPWESFTPTRSWTLTEGDGVKTVYFRASNDAGESISANDSIVLAATPSGDMIEIRGNVVNAQDAPSMMPVWDAQSFAGFFYDVKHNRKTEYLTIAGQNLADINASRMITEKNLRYMTGKAMQEFRVHEKEDLNVIDNSIFYETEYPIVGLKGEKWIAANGNANKLSKFVYEMGSDEIKTLSKGEKWALGAGYELTVNDIDAKTTPILVWFSLKKDGKIIDEGIASEKTVYYKTQMIKGESALLFTVYVESILPDKVQFKYAWLTDADSAIELQAGEKYDAFIVKEASRDIVILENEGYVDLSRKNYVKLLGRMGFRVADSDVLGFYPFVEYRDPGIYEIRGKVFTSPEDNSRDIKWDGQTFSGFFYNIDNNVKTEYLNITGQTLQVLNSSRAIGENNLIYTTGKTMIEFKIHEKEALNVINNSKIYEDKYPAVGWKGEKWIAAGGNASVLSKLVYEMSAKDSKSMSAGETWALGSGYDFTVNAIDARTSPPQVWFSLLKDGKVIDDGISTHKSVYYKTQTINGESDALLFAIYIERIYAAATSDIVQFRYAWLTDADSAIIIKTGDRYDAFAVKEASKDRIILANYAPVNLSKNSEVNLLGDIAFRIADSNNLRFYPKIDRIIADMDNPPHSLSIRIKQGELYSNSRNVTLSVSAYNAKEMSFSNDNITWSVWEPYNTRKLWMLADGEGAKAVYFKARNAAGEASSVIDTIILDTIPPSVVITSPKNNAVINESSIKIIGNASDTSGIKWGSITHVAGEMSHSEEWPVNNSTSLSFSHEMMLHEGSNHFLVSYMDAANNFGYASINLTLPEGKPAVFINLSGIVMINQSTKNVLSVDYMHFNKKDPYFISITNINDSSVVYKKSGKLKGKHKETFRIKWIPRDTDRYRIEARGNTTTAINKTITIYDIEIVSPIPELPTLALTLAGLIGVIGFAGKRRRED